MKSKTIDRTPRFSRNQATSNIGMLLYQLGEICLGLLKWELYGVAYKHGLDPINGEFEKHREELALAAVELFQETGMEKGDLARVWEQVLKDRAQE